MLRKAAKLWASAHGTTRRAIACARILDQGLTLRPAFSKLENDLDLDSVQAIGVVAAIAPDGVAADQLGRLGNDGLVCRLEEAPQATATLQRLCVRPHQPFHGQPLHRAQVKRGRGFLDAPVP
jgi:hypothetical protein